jgi:hypothetical protein
MSRAVKTVLVAALVASPLLVTALFATTAGAADAPAARETVISGLPGCDDGWVQSSIRRRFAHGAAHVEHRDLAIATIDGARETFASVNAPSPIARRWCAAGVTLSDGTRSQLYWRMERGTGFAAPGLAYVPDGLEFCVVGHDPWHVHDGECRTTRRYW